MHVTTEKPPVGHTTHACKLTWKRQTVTKKRRPRPDGTPRHLSERRRPQARGDAVSPHRVGSSAPTWGAWSEPCSLASLAQRTACAPTQPSAPAHACVRGHWPQERSRRTEGATGDNPKAQQQPKTESVTRSHLERSSAVRAGEAAATTAGRSSGPGELREGAARPGRDAV